MSNDKTYQALHLKYCALHQEMQVMSDQLTCALLESKENAEIAQYLELRLRLALMLSALDAAIDKAISEKNK